MYFADISIINSGVREAYAHVYHLYSYYVEYSEPYGYSPFHGLMFME